MQTKFIRAKELQTILGIHKNTIYRRVNAGLLPKPISLGGTATAWLNYEIIAIQAALIRGESTAKIQALVRAQTTARQTKAA
jgi:prophage regulatory protein